MSLLAELVTHLQGEGLGTGGVNLFMSQLPDTPDAASALIEYGGTGGDLRLSNGRPLDELPRVQVLVRAKTYLEAETKARQLYTALHMRVRTLGTTLYIACQPLQPPFYLKRDEKGRTLMVFNLEARRIVS